MNKKRLILIALLLVQISIGENSKQNPNSDPLFDESTGLWVSTRPQKKRKRGPSSRIRFGFKGGINISNVVTEPADDYNSRVLPVGGIALEVPIAPHFLFQTELDFAQYGFSQSETIPGLGTVEVKVKSSSLQLGVYTKIRLMENPNPVKPFILLGGGTARELSTAAITTNGQTTETTDVSAQTNDWDFAFVGGLGIQFEISENVDLGVEARYLLGLTDGSVDTSTVAKNRTFYIGASLFF